MGWIRYDAAITRARVPRQTVLEEQGAQAADDLRALALEVERVCKV